MQDGTTPLYAAASRDDLPSLRLLIERGAEVEACDGKGLTPLIAAAKLRQPECLVALIKAGANVNASARVCSLQRRNCLNLAALPGCLVVATISSAATLISTQLLISPSGRFYRSPRRRFRRPPGVPENAFEAWGGRGFKRQGSFNRASLS